MWCAVGLGADTKKAVLAAKGITSGEGLKKGKMGRKKGFDYLGV